MTELFEHRNPVEVLAEEFLDRRTRGETTSVHEYVLKYPDLATEIGQLFPMMMAMEQLKTSRFVSSGESLKLEFDIPQQLGDFRIIREIARGGMGVVYDAEQMSLNRRVALKIIPPQVLSDASQLARFQQEAKTAASLHHTNIVPVFGVGEHDGLHFYVMQKINGEALDYRLAAQKEVWPKTRDAGSRSTSTCDKPSTGGETAAPGIGQQCSEWKFVADIGIQVAKALSYAHEHGVVHRDIKPGNLLLDPQGTVWVTDFGLATALGAKDQETVSSVAGTLRFMAPEHLGGKSDERSDIYGLGVTLYELLTHQPAFANGPRTATIQRIVNADFAALRKWRPEIPADLEAIVLKAMACDPESRYQRAIQLAQDLQRFVDDRPVAARPLTLVARAWRWGRRNPVVSGLSTVLLLGAVFSFCLISAEWQSAVAESRRAENNLSLALESMDRILERFTSGWMAHPVTVGDLDNQLSATDVPAPVTVSNYSAAVLEDSLRFYDKFAQQNATNPQLKQDTAKVHRRVGEIYARIGNHQKAGQAFRRSLQMMEGRQGDVTSVQALEWAEVLNELGLTLHAVSQFPEASVEFRNAKRILKQSRFADNPACQAEIARAELNLGQTLWLMGQRREASKCHQHAIQLLEHLVSHSSEAVQHRQLLAHAYRISNGFPSSESIVRTRTANRERGIEILEQLVHDFPTVPDYQCELSEMLVTSAPRLRRAQDAERAVGLARSLVRVHPSIPRYRAALAGALKAAGDEVQRASPEDAEAIFAESVALYRQLSQNFPEVPVYRLLLSTTLRTYSSNARRRGEIATARERLEEAIDVQEQFVSARPDSMFGRRRLQGMKDELAKLDQSSEDASQKP